MTPQDREDLKAAAWLLETNVGAINGSPPSRISRLAATLRRLSELEAGAGEAKPVAWCVFAKVNGQWVAQWPFRETQEASELDRRMYMPGTELQVRPVYASPLPAVPVEQDGKLQSEWRQFYTWWQSIAAQHGWHPTDPDQVHRDSAWLAWRERAAQHPNTDHSGPSSCLGAETPADGARDNAVLQARSWAQEARTQRGTVLDILRYFGLPERDWEALRLIRRHLEGTHSKCPTCGISPPAPQVRQQGVRMLKEEEIMQGWLATFSTNNPFCPCDLKSFTKAARWAESFLNRAALSPADRTEGSEGEKK